MVGSVCVEFGYDSANALVVSEKAESDVWVMDSGCSYHMTFKRDWFQNYQEINGGKVLLGNDHECKVLGIGDIRLKMVDGSFKTLTAERHVPELREI